MESHLRISGTLCADVLIIGAGGAGMRCAAEIIQNRPGTKIIALTKMPSPQKSHTSTAQGGLAAVDPQNPLDSNMFHIFDTWKGSDCSADQNVIQKIVESAWEQILWLENHGMHFSRDAEGRLSKRTFGGHTINFGQASAFRAVFEADRTGKGIIDTVWGQALKGGITFLNQSIATELLFRGDRCVGAVVFRQNEGEFIKVLAKVSIMATGGSGQVFKVTTNCRQNTGDGLSLVIQSGLPVMDPEAVQFHPTGIVGTGILASEALRGEGGILRNKNLEPFMEVYAPKMKDLAPRDLVARAIETEIREGRGFLNPDHQIEHVWIDLTHLSEYVHKVKLPEISGFFQKFMGIDPRKELCPVRPSNHYHMGGIPTNEYGEVQKNAAEWMVSILAVGECASASLHGFNRLATNSLLELITMGKFVGRRVLDYLEGPLDEPPADAGRRTLDRFAGYLEAKGRDNLGIIRESLKEVMTEKVGVFRTESGLKEALEKLLEFEERARQCALSSRSLRINPELLQRWELDNLLCTAMLISQGALRRKESRGGHFREDFPERSNEYDHHTLAFMSSFGNVTFESRPIDMSIFKAGDYHHDKLGMIERKY